MTEATGWPGAPGVPANPERDGWHWLTDDGARTLAVKWVAEIGAWVDGAAHSPQGVVDLEYRYGGPCLLPAEVLAREAAAAEAMREACAVVAGPQPDEPPDVMAPCQGIADDIRALPLPSAPDALARIRAEAVREGMLAAAAWHDDRAEYHYGMAEQLIADGRFSTAQRASENAEAHEQHAAAIRAAAGEGTP